ncbi:MAG: hypothetical protein A2885_01175 [Sphingopyxis sp. RIFCSPHIGHO2_01_FULL_65_24]|nr:MAG: hypothetical protein A2885_01175 [Sphingopyxis sp. RIFCSPHIGHO2_01_FULL_65_24]
MTDMTLGDGIALLQRRGRLLRNLLAFGWIVLALACVGQIAELNGRVSLDEDAPVVGLNALYLGVSVSDGLLAFTTFVVFCMWTYRAAANVKAARVPGFGFTPAWSVGWHFVPIANLFKPFQAMRQIWAFSHGGDRDGIRDGQSLLIAWWGLWSLSLAVGMVLGMAAASPVTPDEKHEAIILAIVNSATNLALYPLALRLVARLTEAQRDRLTAAGIFT